MTSPDLPDLAITRYDARLPAETSSNALGLGIPFGKPPVKLVPDYKTGLLYSRSVSYSKFYYAVSNSNPDISLRAEDETKSFLRLSPFKRIIFLLKNEPLNAFSILAGIVFCTYVLGYQIVYVVSSVLGVAYAQHSGEVITSIQQHDPFDWFLASLMAVVLIITIVASLTIKETKKLNFAMDMTKLILGVVLGMLGKGRA